MKDTGITEINVTYPEARERHLRINVGACRLTIKPGAGPAWVTGTYRDPSGALPCRIIAEGGTVRITQDQHAADWFGLWRSIPDFDLALGRAQPYALTLETGASETSLDLGELPISCLVVKQGAGKTELDFSAPNPEAMSLLEIGAGATPLLTIHTSVALGALRLRTA